MEFLCRKCYSVAGLGDIKDTNLKDHAWILEEGEKCSQGMGGGDSSHKDKTFSSFDLLVSH